jgi:hypothetical protein
MATGSHDNISDYEPTYRKCRGPTLILLLGIPTPRHSR